MAELERDPGYVTFREEAEQETQLRSDDYQQAAVGVLNDLREAGYPVEAIGELPQSGFRYPGAVPVLVRWLPKVSDRSVKEDIIRALSVPWAKADAEPILREEFRRLPTQQDPTGVLRWTIGNALEAMADRSSFDGLVDLAQDRRFGFAREMVVRALAKTKDPRAIDVLIGLLQDPDVVIAALAALGKLRAEPARSAVTELMGHHDPDVRKEAKKALGKIDRGHVRPT
jgi:hypothetical protein